MKFFRLKANTVTPVGAGPVVCTIGNFDGVHRGHRALIERVTRTAAAEGLTSAVIVFEPQPLEHLAPMRAPARLMSWREKTEALFGLGIDTVFCLHFDDALSQQTPETFVRRILVERCAVKRLVVGDDFRFGCDRCGGLKELRTFGGQSNLSVDQAETCRWDADRVSSTRVRAALADGDFAQVEGLLGRPFEVSGKVVYGDGIGRTLGYPTANLKVSRPQLPLRGVYAVRVAVPGRLDWLPAVANLGVRPTFGRLVPRHEVHVMRFSGDLYGQRLTVRFLRKLRDETRFESIEALQSAIADDVDQAEAFFSTY
ncbi:MAG: bifunctional riboflavin kinase/FAD synthetase [Gammaproteobacteria bacterium]